MYRPTRDLDFTGYLDAVPATLLAAFREILAVPSPDDGLVFDVATLVAEPIREEVEYGGGLRVKFRGALGSVRIPMQVDVGFGNAIQPPPGNAEYPSLLGGAAPRIRAYPPEAVVAEKLHAMVVLGERNSRFKDFYDLYALSGQFAFDGARLAAAVAATFERRRTRVEQGTPAALTPSFYSDSRRAEQWRAYLARSRLPGAPASFEAVGERMRGFLGPVWMAVPVFVRADLEAFAKVYFDKKATQDRLYAALAPVVERFRGLPEDEQRDFRGQVTDYVRLYAFLSQILTFADPELERLYVFARHLRRLLPVDREELPVDVQQNIDMESYRVQQTSSGKIGLERKPGVLAPQATKADRGPTAEELEPLSRIIAELNERFGLALGPEHKATLHQMMSKLDEDAALEASSRVNTRENVRLTFDHKVEQVIQEIVDSNFELYKRITDDPAFGETLKNALFDQYLRTHRRAEELVKRSESKTLEFKSSLRWNLRESRQDDKAITFAVLKTIAAFLNTDGGDLLIGLADDRKIIGIEYDQLENDDKYMRHLAQVVRNGLGDRAGTCIDPEIQIVEGKPVCVVSCQRSPEPVFLKWKGTETSPDGDLYVRSGPGSVKLPPESAKEYVRTRFGPPPTSAP